MAQPGSVSNSQTMSPRHIKPIESRPRIVYNASMFRALTLICVLASMGGCVSPGPLDLLDQKTQRLIRDRQQSAIGTSNAQVPDIEPAPSPSADIADNQPQTHNPAAVDLPAKRQAPATTAGNGDMAIPAVLDPEHDAISLDLKDILAYAIAHSPEYRSQKEDLYIIALALIIERHLWGPRFFDTITATVDGTPESGDHDIVSTLLNQFTITHKLPYGGSVSVNALVDYVSYLRQSSSSSSTPWHSQGAEINAAIDLPLLRGAGRVAREDLIQAERDLIYAVRDFERFRREFLVEMSNTYFDLILRQQRIENVQTQLVNLERLADRFEALAAAGKEPYFEAERTQAQVLFGRSNLLNSQEAYTTALDTFKIRVGMPTTQNLIIVVVEIIVPQPQLDVTATVATAWELRLDLQTSANRIEDAQRRVEVAANQRLPDLDFAASIELPTASNDTIAGLDLDPGSGSYSAGFSLGLPQDRQIETANLRSAQIRMERARRDHVILRDTVALQVRRAIRAIERARFNLQLQKRNVLISKRRDQGVRLRERSLGPRDVIEAQEAILDASNQRDEAEAELRRSVLRYLLDSGQMRVAANGRWQAPGQLLLGSELPTVVPKRTNDTATQ
jgi:outer membrane protein TolC